MKRRLSPAEKKALSYERDGVNCYGENNKASRKAIPRFKAATNRTMRRSGREVIASMALADEDRSDAVLAEITAKGSRPWKRKIPDLPLGLALEQRDGVARSGRTGRNVRAAVKKLRRKV